MRRSFILSVLVSVLIFGCQKDDEIVPVVDPIVDPVEEEVEENVLPDYIRLTNPELGTVQIVSNQLSGSKRTLELVITGNESIVHWELSFRNEKNEDIGSTPSDDFQGIITVDESSEIIHIKFVNGPLFIEIPDTQMRYRHDFEWDGTCYARDFVIDAYNTSVSKMANSNAEELVPVLNSIPVIIYKDGGASAAIGLASGNKISLNVYNSSSSSEVYSGVFIHEIAHIYEGRNPAVSEQCEVLYDNATWNNSKGYYNTNFREMWATAVSEYVNASGGSHLIGKEDYYTSSILPYLQSVFE